MLFLVLSTPNPSKPDDVKNLRLQFRVWIEELKSKNKILHFYPKIGRGSVVIFDVSSNDELHFIITQWLNIIPANFEIHPLATPTKAEELLT